MHDEMPFGLARQVKYAALSSEDLNTMGKRAADSYLSCGVPLNKAVVKLAQEHPSISPHQVKRVVEYANQETFQRLFDDNEKYASDKNIDFPLADPRIILHELNDGARPHIMTPPPDDYSQAPVKMAHANVEADIELCRMFGVEPVSPGMEKAAVPKGGWGNMQPGQLGWKTNSLTGLHTPVMSGTPEGAMFRRMQASNRRRAAGGMPKIGMEKEAKARYIKDIATKYLKNPEYTHEGPLAIHKGVTKLLGGRRAAKDVSKLRRWSSGGGSVRKGVARVAEKAITKGTAKFGSADFEAVDRILGVEKEAGLQALSGLGRGIMTAGRAATRGHWGQAGKALGEGARRFAASPGSGMLAGAGIGAATGAAAAGPDQRMKGALTGGLMGAAGGAMAGTGAGNLKNLWSKGTSTAPFAAMKPGWRSAAGAGAAGLGGGVLMQKGSSAGFTKEAMDYAKAGRPQAGLVLEDLREATSVDRIKQATASRGEYPEANPYGELIRVKQELTKMAQDARDAAAKNESLYHEALEKLAFEVKQHLLRGGNLGSVAHAMGTVTPPDAVKIAMRAILPDLQKHGLDPVRTQADMVHYEMVKGASSRVLNPKHPIIQSYANMVKLAEGQATLEHGFSQLHSALNEVTGTLKEAMVRHAATR
jgi:hypothetical protein